MKNHKLILYIFIFTGLGIMVITMFHPFDMFYNKFIPSIGVAFLVCIGYYIQTVRILYDHKKIPQNDTISEDIKPQIDNQIETKNNEVLEKIKILKITESNTENFKSKQLKLLCNEYNFGQGVLFEKTTKNNDNYLIKSSSFAVLDNQNYPVEIAWGDGVTGQAAQNDTFIYNDKIPDGFLKIQSGLGQSNPNVLLIAPFKNNNEVVGIVELAGFTTFNEQELTNLKNAIQYLFDN